MPLKMDIKINIIVAACSNRGIGLNGELPWKLKKELAHFAFLTKRVEDKNKTNAVIMGRKTWDSIPESRRPLAKRTNIVLSRNSKYLGPEVHICNSLNAAVELLKQPPLCDIVENVWVIGGSSVYEEAMKSNFCDKIYLTNIKKELDCDTFLSEIPNDFKETIDPDVPAAEQEENGICYEYKVYQKINTSL
ncbi:dihydrofolate reductase-like [Lycorma delicatula]|uniref:dihydrofolate reductase-like n=1 Tax=Lycorma delicatula TaxID=130591 RepID=UPI003F519E13